MPSYTVNEAMARAAEVLRMHGVSTARLDAEVILAFVLNKSRTQLYIDSSGSITDRQMEKYKALIERRTRMEPVAYITGEKEFMSLSFAVNNSVLIPRPETEIIAEEALAIKPLRIVDVGTGSGAIAIAAARYLPACRVWAVDMSGPALKVARHNARRHGVGERVVFIRGNLLDPFANPQFNGYFDLIAANLPYIPSCEMDRLPADVREFEPHSALDGGEDGLTYYRELCPRALELLKTGGVLMLEIGYHQAPLLSEYLAGHGRLKIDVVKDLAGLDRVLKISKL